MWIVGKVVVNLLIVVSVFGIVLNLIGWCLFVVVD